MIKNIAGQKARFLAINTSTNTKVTGDAANITAYISKDGGALTQLTDTSATEIDATNAPGEYWFDVSQTESNADTHTFSAKSSSANVVLIYLGSEYSVPVYSSTLAIDSNGRVDVSKIGGTSQTARDIGNSVLISSGTGTGQLDVTSGVVKANLVQILGTALTETAGYIAAGFKKFFNVATPTGTQNLIPEVTTVGTVINAEVGAFPQNVFQDPPDVNVASITDNTITTSSIATGAFTWAKFASDFGTGIAQSVWNALKATITTANSIGKHLIDSLLGVLDTGTHKPQSGDAYNIVNSVTYGNQAIKNAIPSASSVATEVSNITIDGTLDLQATLALITAIIGGIAEVNGNSVVFKRHDGVTTAVTVVHDSSGNRTEVTIGTLP